jgi:acyl-homoserine lactone acylase PvdQ
MKKWLLMATVIVVATAATSGHGYLRATVPQARIVVDFPDGKSCRIVSTPGTSDNSMSPHKSDQVQTWYGFKSRPLALYREEVDEDARYMMKMLRE